MAQLITALKKPLCSLSVLFTGASSRDSENGCCSRSLAAGITLPLRKLEEKPPPEKGQHREGGSREQGWTSSGSVKLCIKRFEDVASSGQDWSSRL